MDYRHQKLDLPGLQTFTIFTTNSRVYMYAIRSFTLVKYELVQEQYSLQAHSDHPILKEIKIEAEIVCSEAAVGGKIST